MSFQIDLKKFLTPSKIKDYIQSTPIKPRIITEELYSKDVDTYESPVFPYAEIEEVTGNVPLVIRGSEPLNVSGDKITYNFIEVQPINIAETLSPVEVLNMRAIGEDSIEKIIKQKVEKFRRIILDTIEALASQSINGRISYQVRTQTGTDTFEVIFGEIKNLTPSTPPSTLKDLYNLLIEMETTLQERGYGQEIKIFAGKTAFSKILDISMSYTGKSIYIEQKDGGLYIGNYFIKPVASGYKNINGEFVRAISDNTIKMIDTSAPFKLRYLAIDDFRAGLQALPIFITQKDDKRAIQLEAQSKPFLIPVTKAIVDAQIL